MMGWQRHQLDHMQIICTLLQTDNYTSTSSLNLWANEHDHSTAFDSCKQHYYAALRSRCGHYIFAMWFLLLLFFLA